MHCIFPPVRWWTNIYRWKQKGGGGRHCCVNCLTGLSVWLMNGPTCSEGWWWVLGQVCCFFIVAAFGHFYFCYCQHFSVNLTRVVLFDISGEHLENTSGEGQKRFGLNWINITTVTVTMTSSLISLVAIFKKHSRIFFKRLQLANLRSDASHIETNLCSSNKHTRTRTNICT